MLSCITLYIIFFFQDFYEFFFGYAFLGIKFHFDKGIIYLVFVSLHKTCPKFFD